ncbi:hypothetical protein [Parasitella parasitica]|uniref:Uncharacterized protein n=1 Tax=Parasitella parasitica TaxID=35722 RepID=A0A0B7MZF6_9FUNG|nr:hypothetical protein [Parasitella parasitica]
MSTSTYQIPRLFYRLKSQQVNFAKHFIALREKKKYRQDEGTVIVQGYKTLKELRDQGVKFKSLIVTVKKEPEEETDIKYPAINVIKDPKQFPAQQYYVSDINLARRILGTASKPGNHDIFAEVIVPQYSSDDSKIFDHDRILVLDKISDPGNVGTIVRTAKALGWQSGLITHHSCDLYNDKCVRASRGLALTWPHVAVPANKLLDHLKKHGFTPIVADMLPSNKQEKVEIWSPEEHSGPPAQGTGAWFWNQPKSLPIKKMALILSSEHHGVDDSLAKELRVSLPMDSSVESLNVATAGAIIMSDLNRLKQK